MKRSRLIILTITALEVTAFIAFALWILVTRNSDTLYQAQNFSFFNSSGTFFDECMKLPGGLITWTATFLTQTLYKPMLGASVLIALWIGSFLVSIKAMKMSGAWVGLLFIPLFALLTSIVDNGYWLYYIKQQGF